VDADWRIIVPQGLVPGAPRCLTASNNNTAAAAAAFSDSLPAAIGIVTR
jgi:hypothetical protein